MARGSRGARPRTPRTAIPTSRVKNGARPGAPVLRRDYPPPPVPASNDRVELGSIVTLAYFDGRADRSVRLVAERDPLPVDGVSQVSMRSIASHLLGKRPGARLRLGDGTDVWLRAIAGAQGQRPQSATAPDQPPETRPDPSRTHPTPAPSAPSPPRPAEDAPLQTPRPTRRTLREYLRAAIRQLRRPRSS